MAFEMGGNFVVPAPREEVWRALNDPTVLCRCIQGCQSMEPIGDTSFKADVQMKIGPVSSIFSGVVDLLDIDAPNGYRIEGKGDGGAAGFAKGGATVQLTDAEEGGTLLTYDVNADIGGKLAQLGGRLINGVAKRQADQFFANFAAEFTHGDSADPAPAATDADLASAAATSAHAARQPAAITAVTPRAQGGSPWAWMIALAVAVIAGFMLGRSEADTMWVAAMIAMALVSAGAGYRAGRD